MNAHGATVGFGLPQADEVELLRGSSFLEMLCELDRHALFAAGTMLERHRGDRLLSDGDAPRDLVLIVKGTVKLLTTTPHGREVMLGLRGPGDVLGALSLFDGLPHGQTAVALGRTRVLRVHRQTFRELADRRSPLKDAAYQSVAQSARLLADQSVELSTEDAMTRLCRRILVLDELWGCNADGARDVRYPLAQQDLADWIGVSRDAVVRCLKTARTLGWLGTSRQRIIINDIEAIRARAGFLPVGLS